MKKRTNKNKELTYMDIKDMDMDMYMQEFGFGGWMKKNWANVATTAGGIGLGVAGALTANPMLIGAGASMGMQGVSGFKGTADQDAQLAEQNANNAQLEQQSKLAMADQRIQQTDNPMIQSPGVMAKYGGRLKKYATGGSLFQEYNGQSHEGPNGGIPVDPMGNPTGNMNTPSALVENNETSTVDKNGTYIFSDTLMLNDKNTFAKEHKQIQKTYNISNKDRNMINSIDPTTKKGYELATEELKNKQEKLKQYNNLNSIRRKITRQPESFRTGGNLPKYYGGSWLNNLNQNIRNSVQQSYLNPQQNNYIKFNTEDPINITSGRFFPNDANMLGSSVPQVVQTKPTQSTPTVQMADLPIEQSNFNQNFRNLNGSWNLNPMDMSGLNLKHSFNQSFQPKLGEGLSKTDVGMYKNQLAPEGGYDWLEKGYDWTKNERNISTPEGKAYRGIGWGDAALSAIPGLAGSAINLVRANNLQKPDDVYFGRMTPQQINLQRERDAAIEQANLTRSNASRGLRNNTGSVGQYLANIGSTQTGIGRGLSQQLGRSYQQEELTNAQMRAQADATNLDLGSRETMYNQQQDMQYDNAKRGMYGQAISQGLGAVSGAVNDKVMANQMYDRINMMNPNYSLEQNGNSWFQAFQTPKKRVKNYNLDNTKIGQYNGW